MLLPEFDERYMARRLHIAWRARVIARAVAEVLAPSAVVDFGCATGDVARGLLDLGIPTVGIDSSAWAGALLPAGAFRRLDVVRDLVPGVAFPEWAPVDVGILFEVLSILPSDEATVALGNVARLTCRALILNRLDHARDGAGALAAEGFMYDDTATEALREQIAPWGSKQAVKAWVRTAEVWRRICPLKEDHGEEAEEVGTEGQEG